MSNEIHVGDIGTLLIVTITDDDQVVDLSTATEITIIIKKPNGISYEKTASYYTDGTDGNITYTSVDGDFDAPGNYKIQGRVQINGGTFHSEVSTFKVHCNI